METTYRVYLVDKSNLDIRVNETNKKLDHFLELNQALTGIFITAWNPFSQKTNIDENYTSQKKLKNRIEADGYKFFFGSGIPDNLEWESEESFLVLDVPETAYKDLMKEFSQNAVVFICWGQSPRLEFIS